MPNEKSACVDIRRRYVVHVPARVRQPKRRNHTVSESYLRRFANGRGLLTMVTLPGHVCVPVSVNDATVIKNFYVIRLDDGSRPTKPRICSALSRETLLQRYAPWLISRCGRSHWMHGRRSRSRWLFSTSASRRYANWHGRQLV